MFFNQLTGNCALMFYSTTILETLQEDGGNLDPALGSIIIGIVTLVGAFIVVFPISYFGRKTLLAFGEFAVAISLGLLGIFEIL